MNFFFFGVLMYIFSWFYDSGPSRTDLLLLVTLAATLPNHQHYAIIASLKNQYSGVLYPSETYIVIFSSKNTYSWTFLDNLTKVTLCLQFTYYRRKFVLQPIAAKIIKMKIYERPVVLTSLTKNIYMMHLKERKGTMNINWRMKNPYS